MGIRHAGEWFKVTDGGAPLNCDDAILALERERIAQEKKKLEKFKKYGATREKEINEAKAVMQKKGKSYNPKAKMDQKRTKYIPNWTLIELKAMIKWKAPKRPNLPTNREGLVEVWRDVKNLTPPSNEQRWEQRKEDTLAQFQRNGRYTIERTYIMRRAEQRKKEKLSIQLSKLQSRSAVQVIACAIKNLPEQERKDILIGWKDYSLDDDYSQSTVSSIGEIEIEDEEEILLEDEEEILLGDEEEILFDDDEEEISFYDLEDVDSDKDSLQTIEDDDNDSLQTVKEGAEYEDENGDYGAPNPFLKIQRMNQMKKT